MGDNNKYRNITDVVDWRTCETLSPEAKEWAEQHFDDDVYDDTPLAYDMLPYALQYAQAGFKIFPLMLEEVILSCFLNNLTSSQTTPQTRRIPNVI